MPVAAGQITYASIPLCKTAPAKGVTYCYGRASDGRVDRDGQIVDEAWSLGALREWLDRGGKVRLAHDPMRPVGRGVEVDGHFVKSAVYTKEARRLLREGVLTAYSVGIERPVIRPDPQAPGGRVVGGRVLELSIVDEPSNVGCGIQLVKAAADGSPQFIGKAFGTPPGRGTVRLTLPPDLQLGIEAADLAKLAAPPLAKGKLKIICPKCGARQSKGHKVCPECGKRLGARALQVRKNHDFTCLGCGKTLDKGEKWCPECGKQNPGYLSEADRKIPANEDVQKARRKGAKVKIGSKRWRKKQLRKVASGRLLTKAAGQRAARRQVLRDFTPSIYDANPEWAEAAWAARSGRR